MYRIKSLCIIIFVLFLSTLTVRAQKIVVKEKVAFDKTAEFSGIAGDDIVNVYENDMGDYKIRVLGRKYGKTWHVEVMKSTDNWDSNFVVEVKRDPSDTRVTGGDTYLTVPDEPTADIFFWSNNKKNIRRPNLKIQYRVSGVTASSATPGTYTTTITYTLVDD